MKIKVQPWTIAGRVASYKLKEFEPCCHFTDIDSLASLSVAQDDNPYADNFGDAKLGVYLTTVDDIEGDESRPTYRIDYCPFCGEKIEIEELPPLDMTRLRADISKEIAEAEEARTLSNQRLVYESERLRKLRQAMSRLTKTDNFPPFEGGVFFEEDVEGNYELERRAREDYK